MKSVGRNVFAQLIKLLPMNEFVEISAKYAPPPCNSRKFTARDYFTAMLFGQLSDARSLREVEIGLATAGGKVIHTGGRPMKRTTLAYNNNQAQPEFYKQFYFRFLSSDIETNPPNDIKTNPPFSGVERGFWRQAVA